MKHLEILELLRNVFYQDMLTHMYICIYIHIYLSLSLSSTNFPSINLRRNLSNASKQLYLDNLIHIDFMEVFQP